MRGKFWSARAAAVGACALAISLAAAGSASAAGEFEPNDSFNTAVGPLVAGLPVSASIETVNDEDYFYFYVPQRTQLLYSLRNTSPFDNTLCADIYRQENAGPDGVSGSGISISDGETSSNAVTLGRGKYYFVVSCGGDTDNIGETYTFTLNPPGSLSDYGPFAAACAAAHAPVTATAATLAKAKAKLRRAKAKHRRRAIRKNRAKVKDAKDAFNAAVKAEQQACAVPQ